MRVFKKYKIFLKELPYLISVPVIYSMVIIVVIARGAIMDWIDGE